MSSRSFILSVLLAVALVASMPLTAGLAPAATTATAGEDPFAVDEDLEADDIVISIELREDGTGAWSIEHRYRLDDADTEEAFESMQANIEENQSAYVERFADRMEPTIDSAAERTDREMAMENVAVSAEQRSLPQEYGIVTYEFDWIGFAVADDTSITAGDALSGFFLDEETRLVMAWPPGYAVESVSPTPDDERDRSVTWHGPKDFGPGEPELVVVTEDHATDPIVGLPAAVLVGAAVLVAVAIIATAFWWRTRGTGVAIEVDTGEPGSGTVDEAGAPADSIDSDPDRADAAGADEEPSWELLSNEEKVMRLLEERGGRMKQQALVERFDWSDANASQVVRSLREDGKIETFRIGRENVIVRAGEDLEETK